MYFCTECDEELAHPGYLCAECRDELGYNPEVPEPSPLFDRLAARKWLNA